MNRAYRVVAHTHCRSSSASFPMRRRAQPTLSAPGAAIITDDWSGYAKPGERGYFHTAVAERGDMQVAGTCPRDSHHGVSPRHLPA